MLGVAPSQLMPMFSPRELDLKSLALHELVAQRIRADPRLFSEARDTLERMLDRRCGAPHPYAAAWLAVFDKGLDETLALATADTEQGQAMRSSSPFASILSEDERLDFLTAWASRRTIDPI